MDTFAVIKSNKNFWMQCLLTILLSLMLTACGGSSGNDNEDTDNPDNTDDNTNPGNPDDNGNSDDDSNDDSNPPDDDDSSDNNDNSNNNNNNDNSGDSPTDAKANCPSAPALADTSSPNSVVGSGSPASCTQAELAGALASGGVITFNCGDSPHTISISSEQTVSQDTVIDGGGNITLDGGNNTRILAIRSTFDKNTPNVTIQRMKFQNGRSSGSGADNTLGGGAIYRVGGELTVIDSDFTGNSAPQTGQDIAGGAIYSLGGGKTLISNSRFTNNTSSNGGAIGNLHNDLVVLNSVISNNDATGSGGNPGNGGNGGGIYIDGNGQEVTLCGMQLTNNTGRAFGGGLFRVSNDGNGSHTIDQSNVDGNSIEENAQSQGGGLYLQGMATTITNTTVSNNSSRHSGGIFFGPQTNLTMLNTTIAHNTATGSLGGGIVMDAGLTGSIKNVTFANNRSPASNSFAAATVGGTNVTLQNSIIDGHEVGNGFNPISCRDQLTEGGGNLQFPVLRSGAGSDDPGSLCTSGVLVADSKLGDLVDNGGPTLTLMPASDSPAIGQASNCPETDQRGEPRGEPCTSGAVEVN